MTELESLYFEYCGCAPERVERLAGAGSSRQYFRLTGERTVVGCIGDDIKENEAFIYLSAHLSGLGLRVPEVLAVSADNRCYLQEDLGDVSLYDVIASDGNDSVVAERLMRRTMETLADFHALGPKGIDWSRCFPRESMDRRSIMWDLNYFKYCFVKLTGEGFDEDRLQDELELLADEILGVGDMTLMLRDFQSRNVMIHSDEPYVIDFQGARKGPGLYDVASFLWQARIALPDETKWRLADHYVTKAREAGLDISADWKTELRLMALFRMLQVLGAYGFRGIYEHKAKFVTSIKPAMVSAIALIDEMGATRYAYIRELLDRISRLERFAEPRKSGRLLVTVSSFSYKKGLPEDFSGNGGGFVFDCRAVHNPGRYDRYKPLTGRDRDVIEFLEENGEILDFLDNCYSLVDHAVERYIGRGFTSLTVSFGCTGGRHRSVYSAEHMARHIAEKFDCDVKLIHREQGITEELK